MFATSITYELEEGKNHKGSGILVDNELLTKEFYKHLRISLKKVIHSASDFHAKLLRTTHSQTLFFNQRIAAYLRDNTTVC